MNRYKKKDLLQIVSALIKVNDFVSRAASSTALFEAVEEFASCQESAINLGSYLETLGGDYAPLVRTLEDYCENLYQMNINIQDENLCRKLSKKIRKQLLQLQNAITYNLPPDKKEVVFLPYKASMWDSLESVWKAAQEDANCDAYVIPIPYFDKNPDGSFREEHYEGGLYPKDVPITRYDEYNFEERRPDAIFIHNAYDNQNLVTSVHPFFYSGNLKKFTDRLVYIPYFVLNEIKPEDDALIENIKHFCMVPGIFNADKVIVQSEDMRQVYIKILMNIASDRSERVRQYWEKKISGLGSPKMDKVAGIREEQITIPDEWMKIILKPDGSRKRVIFYNTSIAGLLQHGGKMLRKMEYVFKVFKENKDEIVLLWRPHPLIKATVESMRPQLWAEYDGIVRKYCEEGWGIYDDTADIGRAIGISDAYYGDGSSVVQLYQQTGKPVMIQNVGMVSGNPKVLLSTYSLIDTGENIYFASKNVNGFFRYEKTTGEINPISLKTKPIMYDVDFRYNAVCRYGDKIVFAPFKASEILIYDIYNLDNNIKIDLESKKDKPYYNFHKLAVVYKNLIYFIGDVYSEILRLDMTNMHLEVLNTWKNAVYEYTGKREFIGINTYGDICNVQDVLWVPLDLNNCILELNLETTEAKVHHIDSSEMRFVTICFDGKFFWMTGEKAEIVKWNKATNQVSVIKDFPPNFKKFQKDNYGWNEFFARSLYKKGYIYFFPMAANMIVKVNVSTNEMSPFYVWESLASCYTVEVWDKDGFYIEWGDEDYIQINHSMVIGISGEVRKMEIFQVDKEVIKGSKYENEIKIFYENSALAFEHFWIEKIGHEDNKKDPKEMEDMYGKQIYKNIVQFNK